MSDTERPLYMRAADLARQGKPPGEIRRILGSASVNSVKSMLSRARRAGADIPRFNHQGQRIQP